MSDTTQAPDDVQGHGIPRDSVPDELSPAMTRRTSMTSIATATDDDVAGHRSAAFLDEETGRRVAVAARLDDSDDDVQGHRGPQSL